jgi:hypothetical protein
MNRRFLATQFTATARQSFLWMAPFARRRMADLWRRSALPEEARRESAFAPIDRRTAEVNSLAGVAHLAYQFLTIYLPGDILTKTDRGSMSTST